MLPSLWLHGIDLLLKNDAMHTAGRVYINRYLRTRPNVCVGSDLYAHGRPSAVLAFLVFFTEFLCL